MVVGPWGVGVREPVITLNAEEAMVLAIALDELQRRKVDLSKGRVRLYRRGSLYGVLYGDANPGELQFGNSEVWGYAIQIDVAKNYQIVTSHFQR